MASNGLSNTDETNEQVGANPQSGQKLSRDLSYVVISGGTGANSIATAFGPSPAFVLPVSDDGGSSAEILRCFGGPSIGDISGSPSAISCALRLMIGSRLSRLIPLPEQATTKGQVEQEAIYNLMSYRFPVDAPERVVKDIWMDIVEGKSSLWDGIGEDKKECIRGWYSQLSIAGGCMLII